MIYDTSPNIPLWFQRMLDEHTAITLDELKTVCAEAYQAVGSMASDLGISDTCPQLRRLLDNLSAQKLLHKDVLPWPSFSQRWTWQ